jgi:hypothetical protein
MEAGVAMLKVWAKAAVATARAVKALKNILDEVLLTQEGW